MQRSFRRPHDPLPCGNAACVAAAFATRPASSCRIPRCFFSVRNARCAPARAAGIPPAREGGERPFTRASHSA
jgi:hypothetical protein